MLKTFAELGHVYRTNPCVEYPGLWVVYLDGADKGQHLTLAEAQVAARQVWDAAVQDEQSEGEVSIGWLCSPDDPRIGSAWFTGYYTHSWIDTFGRYRSL